MAKSGENWVVQQVTESVTTLGTGPTETAARYEAATQLWATHLDTWMTDIEDDDVVESIIEILGFIDGLFTAEELEDNDEYLQRYDHAIVTALSFLPEGLRRLAHRYEQEWGLGPKGGPV